MKGIKMRSVCMVYFSFLLSFFFFACKVGSHEIGGWDGNG